jgi:hypothetical protein
MIEQYRNDPDEQLDKLGIKSGTLEAFLYEHRLYSKDIKGYFTTGNSLGSFLILTGFTTFGLIAGKLKRYRKTREGLVDAAILSFILFAQVLCFMASTSKGAGSAALLGFVMLLAWIFFKDIIRKRRHLVFTASALGGGAVLAVITAYAVFTATLPGGKSMMVRAEYWFATARMIADNYLTGVGGGNFGYYYTQYKMPASIETVQDPHNMFLSIFSQYGILGLAGFFLIIFVPLTRIIMPKNEIDGAVLNTGKNTYSHGGRFKYSIAILITVTLFIVRPFLIPVEGSDDSGVMLYIMIVMYAAPAFIFLLVVWLMDKAVGDEVDLEYLQAAMFCGIVAMLLHNFIDMAIFEPGVMSMFFLVVACFVSVSKYRLNHFGWSVKIDRSDAVVVSALCGSALVVVLWLGYIPVVCATLRLQKAFWGKQLDMRQIAEADACDPFSCDISPFIAKVFWSEYDPDHNRDNLALAEKYFSISIKKNPADFKNYMNLAKIRWQQADNTQTYRRKVLLTGAEDAYRRALSRYPGKAELHLELGKVLFLQDKPQNANSEFEAALQIEEMFRKKFARMFPDQEIVSRLDPQDYQFLKGVVEQ